MESTIVTALIGAIATIVTAIIGAVAVRSKDKAYSDLKKEWNAYQSQVSKHDSYLDIDYGIRIISPVNEKVSSNEIEVRGTYKIMPPLDTLRLFAVPSDKTELGERFWPQRIVKEFSQETKTWKAKANITGLPQTGGSIVVAVVGQPTVVLWNYYYKVGPRVGWWDFEGWPTDSVECHRVNIIKA
ncbi:MAG: hypothetical protein HUU57_17465 [Bdellovibrio sp.]|nr:hypothetical protein [Bdellovibrio sp.]